MAKRTTDDWIDQAAKLETEAIQLQVRDPDDTEGYQKLMKQATAALRNAARVEAADSVSPESDTSQQVSP